MSDFENVMRILVEAAGLVFIPVAALAALAAIRLVWKRGSAMPAGDHDAQVERLRARVEELERRGFASGEYDAQDARLAEIENRLDFAERLLTRGPDVGAAPGRPE